MKFNDFLLRPEIFKTLDKIRFDNPTDIQAAVIPLALKKVDIIGKSHTGSGKTHAFLIPIFNMVDFSLNKVQAVILVPTRELAIQVYTMAKPFMEEFSGARVTLLSGGFERSKNIDAVANPPHIVIGTPGRIKDIAFNQNAFNITTADILVVDEADMTFEAGFSEEVGLIAGKMKVDLQMLVFSATFPMEMQKFLDKFMKNPKLIDLNQENPNPVQVKHIAYPTRNRERFSVLEDLLSAINPFMAIIFVTEKKNIDEIYKKLRAKNIAVGVLHGDLDSTTRKIMLKRIKNSEFQYIIASDIAARGLDIEGVSHIINYDLPFEEEFYFHRAGRTGRNGQEGYCYSLYDKEEIAKLEKYMAQGVKFTNMEYKDGKWAELKKLGQRKTGPKKPHPLNDEIRKIVSKTKKQQVKPGYKKKMHAEIEKLKKKHKRDIIEKDIKKRIVERAIARTKDAKNENE